MSGGRRYGQYELQERLGHGGMAEVFRARYEGAAGAQREVVLKRILPFPESERAGVERLFVAEARLTLQLTHGNIVQVYDFGEADGQYYLAMELVEGLSLADLLVRSGKKGLTSLPAPLAALILIEVCKGLHYAHTRADQEGRPLHIVHRDVTPENVLLGADGQVKVADFGIARASMAGRETTAPGLFRGKLAYSAPEQLRAEAVDARADVYSCGLILWRMLTGENPQRELALQLAAGTERLPAPPAERVGAPLAAILAAATEPDPAQRTPSARALELALEAWLRTQEVPHAQSAISQLVTWVRGGPGLDPAFTAWLWEPATGASPAQPAPAARQEGSARVAMALLAVALVISAPVLWVLWRSDPPAPSSQPPASFLRRLPAPAPMAEAPASPPPTPAPPALPRSAVGAPATFTLAGAEHGLDVATLGMPVKVDGAGWAARLEGSPARALFYAPLAAPRHGVQVLGKEWSNLEPPGGRLFGIVPEGWRWRFNEPLALRVGKRGPRGVVPIDAAGVPSVGGEAMTIVEAHRFVLEGLDRAARYRVTSRPVAGAVPGPVIVTFTFSGKGEPVASLAGPPRQALLQPGGSLEVRNVAGLSLMLLTWPDEAKESRVEISVAEASSPVLVERASPEARALDAKLKAEGASAARRSELSSGQVSGSGETVEGLLNQGAAQMAEGRAALAIPIYERCLVLAPGQPECALMLRRARQQTQSP